MLKTIRADLDDVTDSLEHLQASLQRLTREEMVDVGARIRAVIKSANQIDETVKADIKLWLKGKAGVAKGELFKACLALVEVNRLDQLTLKVDRPDIYNKFLKKDVQTRVTYEPR